jgi:hypothetical protein
MEDVLFRLRENSLLISFNFYSGHLDIVDGDKFFCGTTFKGKKLKEIRNIKSKEDVIDYCIKYGYMTLEESIALQL